MEALFDVAVNTVNEYGKAGLKITNDQALQLYGLFKQATVGNVNTGRPGMFDPKGKAKWDAWNSQKDVDSQVARAQYVETARAILPPDWSIRIA